MQLKKILDQLEKSDVFLEWKKDHKDSYLTHFFKMFDDANKDLWQIGYYDKKTKKITTFAIADDTTIHANPETDDVFKEPGKDIIPLKLEDIKIQPEKAIEIGLKLRNEKYKEHLPFKTFFIIQNLPESGSVYNLTLVTKTFSTINIKISTKDGKIIKEQIASLMDLGEQIK